MPQTTIEIVCQSTTVRVSAPKPTMAMDVVWPGSRVWPTGLRAVGAPAAEPVGQSDGGEHGHHAADDAGQDGDDHRYRCQGPDRSPATGLDVDAAHGFPPSQAQGATQALEDAWSLTHALSDTNDAPAALRRYERTRARRVRRIARTAASEITERAPRAARWAAKMVPSAVASRIYVHQLRSFSSVLNDERP